MRNPHYIGLCLCHEISPALYRAPAGHPHYTGTSYVTIIWCTTEHQPRGLIGLDLIDSHFQRIISATEYYYGDINSQPNPNLSNANSLARLWSQRGSKGQKVTSWHPAIQTKKGSEIATKSSSNIALANQRQLKPHSRVTTKSLRYELQRLLLLSGVLPVFQDLNYAGIATAYSLQPTENSVSSAAHFTKSSSKSDLS